MENYSQISINIWNASLNRRTSSIIVCGWENEKMNLRFYLNRQYRVPLCLWQWENNCFLKLHFPFEHSWLFKMLRCPNLICISLSQTDCFVFWAHEVPRSGLFPLYHTCSFKSIFHDPMQSLPKQFGFGMTKTREHATVFVCLVRNKLPVSRFSFACFHTWYKSWKSDDIWKPLWAVGQVLGKVEENCSWQDTQQWKEFATFNSRTIQKVCWITC